MIEFREFNFTVFKCREFSTNFNRDNENIKMKLASGCHLIRCNREFQFFEITCVQNFVVYVVELRLLEAIGISETT